MFFANSLNGSMQVDVSLTYNLSFFFGIAILHQMDYGDKTTEKEPFIICFIS